jgi:hypothetical protein
MKQLVRHCLVHHCVVLSLVFLVGLGALGFLLSTPRRVPAHAQAGKPVLILYWEEELQGRSLEVTGSLADLPVETDAFGNQFDWNDNVRSLVVLGGTWRLFQNGRSNTKIDETPLEALDVRTKEKEAGWSTLVSATSAGPLELSSGAVGGFYRDISSIELVSVDNLPDWAAPVSVSR